jgi:plastocyanin
VTRRALELVTGVTQISRRFRVSRSTLVAVAVSATVLSLFAASATAAPIKLTGKVGPGETITLLQSGKKVKKLRPGTYRITVRDLSSDHDFRLVGPGVNKVVTGVGFTGTRSVTVTLKRGTYRFFCAPHADDMHGGFTVA